MVNLEEEVSKYVESREPPRPLEFEFVGESYGCDPLISELTVPHVVIYIPKGFIRKYNLATAGKNSEALPDANEMWDFLSSSLVGRGLAARDFSRSEGSVDDVVKELLEWPHGAEFYSNNRKGVLLNVRAKYNPYW